MDLRTQHMCRFGAMCALIAGAAYMIIVVCAFILPQSIATYVATEQYVTDFLAYKSVFIFLKWMMIVSNLAMIGVVYTFFSLSRDENVGMVGWMSIVAIIGYGIGCLQSVQDLSVIPYLTELYATGDPTIQKIILTMGVSNPYWFVITLGFPGIWFIGVSIKASTNQYIPKLLVLLGFLWGCGNILTALAHALVILPLIYLVALGAIVFAPVWSIYEGIFLLRIAREGMPYLDKSA